MLPFVVSRQSWATRCNKKKRIIFFLSTSVNFKNKLSHSCARAGETIHTHGIEMQNLKLIVSHRVSSDFLHETWQHLSQKEMKEKKIYFPFLSTLNLHVGREHRLLCRLHFFLLLFVFICFSFFCTQFLTIFFFTISASISNKMENRHFIVLFVSALACMPKIAAERFIETKYHCPKRYK